MTTLNGMNVGELADAVAAVRDDSGLAERKPHLVARWLGSDRSQVEIEGKSLDVSGPGRLDPMQLVLAALASCEIDTIATHATLMGIAVEAIEIGLDAHFDVRSYLGLDGPPSGYDQLRFLVRLRAPGITPEQSERLRAALHRASPVAATLARPLRLESRLEIVH